MNKIRNKILGLGALATAVSSGAFASGGSTTTAPDWATNLSADSFDAILSKVAPIALAVVFGVAGVRVAIKLINRGAGK